MGRAKRDQSQNLATEQKDRQDTIKGISKNGEWQRYNEEKESLMDKPTSKRSHVTERGGAGQAGRQKLKRWNGRMTEWRVRSGARRWESAMFVKGYAWTTLDEDEEERWW